MFLHLSFCSRGGVSLSACRNTQLPWADTPWEAHTPQQAHHPPPKKHNPWEAYPLEEHTPPPEKHTPLDGHLFNIYSQKQQYMGQKHPFAKRQDTFLSVKKNI